MATALSTAGSPSNTRVATAHPSHNPNGISIGAAVVAGLTSVTDGQTNRPRYSVGSTSTAMRPNKNIALLWHIAVLYFIYTMSVEILSTAAQMYEK